MTFQHFDVYDDQMVSPKFLTKFNSSCSSTPAPSIPSFLVSSLSLPAHEALRREKSSICNYLKCSRAVFNRSQIRPGWLWLFRVPLSTQESTYWSEWSCFQRAWTSGTCSTMEIRTLCKSGSNFGINDSYIRKTYDTTDAIAYLHRYLTIKRKQSVTRSEILEWAAHCRSNSIS